MGVWRHADVRNGGVDRFAWRTQARDRCAECTEQTKRRLNFLRYCTRFAFCFFASHFIGRAGFGHVRRAVRRRNGFAPCFCQKCVAQRAGNARSAACRTRLRRDFNGLVFGTPSDQSQRGADSTLRRCGFWRSDDCLCTVKISVALGRCAVHLGRV